VRRAALLALAALVLTACGRAGGNTRVDVSNRLVNAVATTGMVADVVEEVGGRRVRVEALMGAGVDPHLYKASEGDVGALVSADVIFYNGLHLEAAMGDVLEELDGRVQTVPVADNVDPDRLLSPPEFQGQFDPHVWFDVSMWMEAVRSVRSALIDLDPGHGDVYRDNAALYLDKLEALDSYVTERARTVPEQARVLITAHDAFNYFGRAYGFEVRGLQGISTAAEAGTADVSRLVEFIVARRVPAVFVESSVPAGFVEAVQAAVAERGFELAIGGRLYSDAMGTPGTPDGTYPGMVRHNIDTIVRALT
jgi:manganese/zinc/iron transport system substrate-binding protein